MNLTIIQLTHVPNLNSWTRVIMAHAMEDMQKRVFQAIQLFPPGHAIAPRIHFRIILPTQL